MTHLQELLLDLGKLNGALTLAENRKALLHMLAAPDASNDRVGPHLLRLHEELTSLLREGGLLGPMTDEHREV